MHVPVLALARTLVIGGSIGLVVALPMACAEGASPYGIGFGGGVSGQGGQTTTVTATGGTTTTTGFPTSTSTTSTTTGFPSATTSTTSGFPTSSTTTSGFPTSTTSSTSVSTSSGTMGSPCDVGGPGMTQCQNCVSCAQNDTCALQTLNCEFDCDCINIITCIQAQNCMTQACIDQCTSSASPQGQADFDALNQCLASACSNTCS